MFSERFKEDWLPIIVDYLPDDEREVVTSLFWEGASLRRIASRLGWSLTTGDLDAKRVERARDQALARLGALMRDMSALMEEHGFETLGVPADA